MKILVTGGAGYIGSACVEYLLNHEHEVTVFDSLITGHKKAVDKRAEFIKGDLHNREQIISITKKGNFDAIMHFAASSLVGESMENPGKYFRNNNAAGLNLLDAAIAGNVKNFVFSSTAAIFGLPEKMPISEEFPKDPINPYGESKLIFEKMLNWYHKIHGLKYISLRYFNAAGATENFGEDHDPETHLIPIILQTALGRRKNVKIYGEDYPTKDGTCVRDFIHILDLAQAHMLALNSSQCGCYNLGTGKGFSVKEIIEKAKEITDIDFPVEVTPRRAGDPAKLIANSELAKKNLGWEPQYGNARDIISSAWNWFQKFPNGYKD